jgi:hypothetical protein
MNDGSDLEGFRILFQTHDIPEFIPLSKDIQVNYNGIIDNMAMIDTLFSDTSIKTKLKITALDDLKAIVADLVLLASNLDPTDQAGIDGRQMFLTLPFRWKDYTGMWHRIDSTKDLAKAVQSSMTAPHSSHSFYEKELVLYIPTSGLFCSRTITPDCKDLSKIFTKAPAPLTKTTAAVLASVLVSGAANAIADQVKAGADASNTVHEVIDLSTAPPEVQKRYYKRLDRNQVVLRRDLSRYRNNLTTDSYGSINEWNFVEFPPIEQSFVISRDGTLWRYLNHQEKTHKTAFKDHFIPFTAFTPKA